MPIENLSIFEDDFWTINQRLHRLLTLTNASSTLLIDKAGQLITSAGDTSQLDTTAFASLSAADFAATAQLATLVGEKEFSTLFHQGEKENIYVATVETRVILAVIFDQSTTLGLVRVRVAQAVADLAKIFQNIYKKLESASTDTFGEGFQSEAEDEIDQLFK